MTYLLFSSSLHINTTTIMFKWQKIILKQYSCVCASLHRFLTVGESVDIGMVIAHPRSLNLFCFTLYTCSFLGSESEISERLSDTDTEYSYHNMESSLD